RQMEESNVLERTWVEITRPYPDTGDAIQQLVTSLKEFGLDTKNVGYERNSYFFPAYQQDRIHTSFKAGRLMDCFGIVEQGRLRKSPYEIDVMRRAARATQAGMQAGLAAAQVGATENDVAAEIARGMFTAGGEYPAVMPYVTSGPRTMIGHATWEGRELQSGDAVFLEVGGCYRRYHTAMMRTALLHDMTPAMEHAQERMTTALSELKAVLRPGITVSDADSIVRTIISDNHVGAELVTRAGYSIGIAFPPSWDEGYILSLMPGGNTVLDEGMTFHVIPWMWGVEGTRTVGISDTIRITETGCESFFDLKEDFTINATGEAEGAEPLGLRAV
ncbi:MAG: ectoine hydrolase, partial [Microbacterium gubbeenense]